MWLKDCMEPLAVVGLYMEQISVLRPKSFAHTPFSCLSESVHDALTRHLEGNKYQSGMCRRSQEQIGYQSCGR